ncbi:hypothetical protein J6590_095041 [Homalodisca vitripennis]|nr:hypothetical protein J6590_095041 [Homalodisca vitripennis]
MMISQGSLSSCLCVLQIVIVSVSGNSPTATLVFTNSIMMTSNNLAGVSVSGNSPTATLVFTNSIMVVR